MPRHGRILLVTAGLGLSGVVFGALAGWTAGALLSVSVPPDMPGPAFARIGALLGAVAGAVLLPAAGWSLMRRVPVGRALVGTLAGTAVGALVGSVARPIDVAAGVVIGAVVGFATAVVLLRRWATRARRLSARPPSAHLPGVAASRRTGTPARAA